VPGTDLQEITSTWKKHFQTVGVSKSEIKMLENSFKVKE